MTGKQQKLINDKKELLKEVELSLDERGIIIDEAISEVYKANAKFLEDFKVTAKAFRGFYILHTYFGMIDDLVKDKCTKKLNDNIQKYLDKQNASKRR